MTLPEGKPLRLVVVLQDAVGKSVENALIPAPD